MILFEGRLPDSAATEELGERLARILRAGDLLVLTGPLGAGKTTMTRGLGRGLAVRGQVASPTFVLARTHPALAVGGTPLVHVDAYRLGAAAELDDLDIDFDRSITVVEWGAGMLDGVAESWLDVSIERPTGADAGATDDGEVELIAAEEPRTIRIEAHGPRWAGVVLPA